MSKCPFLSRKKQQPAGKTKVSSIGVVLHWGNCMAFPGDQGSWYYTLFPGIVSAETIIFFFNLEIVENSNSCHTFQIFS